MPKAETNAPRTRELTKQETREALILAGITVFAAEGLDAPSLDSICARAGYTRGAFYVHFKDRDDFIAACMQYLLTGFVNAILESEDAPVDLARVVEMFVTAVESGASLLRGPIPMHQFLAACARSERIRLLYVDVLAEASRRLTEAVRAGQRAGTIRPDVDPESLGLLLVAVALGTQAAMEVRYPFDARAPAAALLKMVAATKT